MKPLLQALIFLPFVHAFAAEPQARLKLALLDGIFRNYPLAADGSVKTVHTSFTWPQLIRQWGADTSRRIAYQTTTVPGVGPVPGAQVRIERDEVAELTVYEMCIPRSELKLFDPEAGRLRFGFNLVSSEAGWPLQWASAAGVFDYWIGSGSFSPSWVSVLPCQTFFGIEH